ncbi:pantoate--beta-alanine ligase [Paenibacillus sp. 32O-W]|jgi:pantoate--beta-alanine ligase|uniref:Pantothenate synthetase n=1 Tax=Paenibacillus cisolokensis TaxID=1658519 RepID=A0ABQ4N6M8_9BACL|nr:MULTISPECIES: pantoate--beta-alanine ligase [Paenibacillus]ALS27803.1 pantoate--beta-alanine ligase [Paenibacillus sp. 32O-W]GIQ63791.1 pantoate--beta-alanine ligase [Paenibacillus cisolokensis]
MNISRSIADVRERIAAFRREHPGASVGFVPTMGYLHEGHAALLRRSVAECDFTVISIFVNPLQFGPNEDLERYPRDEDRDLKLAAECGANLVFLPTVEEMYPKRQRTIVSVSGVTERLCGASRPGHFDGVATVVSKLLHIVGPDRAYFGMKDAQQIAVIRTMVEDLNFPVDIVPVETVREPDGLALSSRNVYLSPEERRQAAVLSQALEHAQRWSAEPGMTAPVLEERVKSHIRTAPLAVIDYVEVLTYPELEQPGADTPLAEISGELILALAVKFGSTRLIDNRLLNLQEVTQACSAP